ncbi:MFS transporter [Haloarcula sp. S1CR25-12]|uniref:MFS transporter n=1 Tax=Haloarcula saliterrae TaxID=2950534 RepID=A0ABU2FHA0_9EURY|nr:MFS transporter [Haloarcula sp. S1CR25-12]MDS0261080.1 MFS transporter [Haloarcula sp. S1CR25-12]
MTATAPADPGESDDGEPSPRVVIASVVVSTLFVGFGGGVVFPIFPALGSVLGISPFLVGLILSANRFARLVANAPAGALVDKFGARTPFVAGLGLQAVATLGYVVSLGAPMPEAWFFGARVLLGAASALTFATSHTIAADVTASDSRGRSMGLIRGGSILGFPLGLLLGGVISELAGNRTAFGLAFGFAVVATVLAYATVPETHVSAESTRAVDPWDVDVSLPTVTVGLLNAATWFAYMGVLFASLVLFLEAESIGVLGFDAQGSSGVFMAMTVLSAAVFMFLGGSLSDAADSRVPAVILFLCLLASGFVVLSRATSVWTVVPACLLMGTGMGGTLGPMMALLADLTPADRMGRASGTTNLFSDIGGGLGPVVALPLIDRVGFAPVYVTAAVMPLLAIVVLVVGMYRYTGRVLPETASVDGSGPKTVTPADVED